MSNEYKQKKMVDVLGDFTVFNQFGRNYLYYKTSRIAECVNGDYETRFKGISGWIDKIRKRSSKRLSVIDQTISELECEKLYLIGLICSCNEVGRA